MNQNKTDKQRKPYEKPEAIRFPLRPEEAVLGFCKTTGSGPFGGPCGKVGGCPNSGS